MEQRIAVGRRFGDVVDADHRRCTGLVFDNHRLTEPRAQRIGGQARTDVGRAAGNGRVEPVGAGAADDPVAVDGRKHALAGHDLAHPLHLIGLGSAAEVLPDRRERGADLVGGNLPDLDHAIRSSGA